jgi:hypothetical protein
MEQTAIFENAVPSTSTFQFVHHASVDKTSISENAVPFTSTFTDDQFLDPSLLEDFDTHNPTLTDGPFPEPSLLEVEDTIHGCATPSSTSPRKSSEMATDTRGMLLVIVLPIY